MPGWAVYSHGFGEGDFAQHYARHRESRNVQSASRGARTLRQVHRLHAGAEHSHRRGSGGSAFQLERKAAGAYTAVARPLRQRRLAARRVAQDVARNAGGNDRDNALASELLHEQIQEAGVHQIQRRAADQYFASKRRVARVMQTGTVRSAKRKTQSTTLPTI